jgi:hypothetical protein
LRCSIGSSSPNYFGNNAAATERDEHGKSISTEFTFPAISSDEEMTEKCKELAKRLAEEVESKSLEGFTVTLKLKSVDFEVRTRSKTLLLPTSAEGTLLDTAMELLRKEPNPNIRLMGLRLSNLRSKVVSGNGDRSLASTRPLEYYGFAKLTTPKRTNPASAAVQCPVCNQPLSEDNFEQNEHLVNISQTMLI